MVFLMLSYFQSNLEASVSMYFIRDYILICSILTLFYSGNFFIPLIFYLSRLKVRYPPFMLSLTSFLPSFELSFVPLSMTISKLFNLSTIPLQHHPL